jgi:hypothetical protein
LGGGDEASAVELRGDCKIVVAGGLNANGSSDVALARYNPNGALDTSFSGDGKQTTNVGGFDQANGWRSGVTAR